MVCGAPEESATPPTARGGRKMREEASPQTRRQERCFEDSSEFKDRRVAAGMAASHGARRCFVEVEREEAAKTRCAML